MFVFHHKKITKKFEMVEVLMRPRCAIAMLLVFTRLAVIT